jgi:preprotein translocase subunit YajC
MALLLPILVFVGMYLLILRPQQKRMKQRESLVRAAGIGDEVATVGGVIGIIVAQEEDEQVVSLVKLSQKLAKKPRTPTKLAKKPRTPTKLATKTDL